MLASSPSSSAVTIPTPGKSILKRPPPPQQSFFSLARLSKLLPTQNTPPPGVLQDEGTALKRAHFILPEMTTVYPISATNPPYSPSVKEEKRTIEEREAERRRRVLRGNAAAVDANTPEAWWSMDKVESFYRECCVGREEEPDQDVSAAFKRAANTNPRTVDLSGVQLTVGSASVLSDVFTIEWGLRKLVFKECNLDDQILKPMLHSLLIPDSLTFLSVASNRRLKPPAFRLIAAYIVKTKSLQFLDLSQNSLDKKSVEYIAAALPEAHTSGIVSLRLDDCALKPQALDALANSVRKSSLRNISLRLNRINATGAVAIALMIKDYPDRFPAPNGSTSPSSPLSSPTFSPPPTPTVSYSSPLPASAAGGDDPPPPPRRAGPLPPPPRHPSTIPQTTYTPYVPRSKRGLASANAGALSAAGHQVPLITSSAQGGVTARHPVPPSPAQSASAHGHAAGAQRYDQGPSAALLDKVRALDNLPRMGALRTLDLKGNDIRAGITYIAQVLKRNRTLKVLNLSENKLDVQGLIAIAEALKYNSCLETLDLSKNPCCGPSLEGIQSLRTAFTLNDALKRLFLSSTSMTSAGAIALAEFLPESTSLLHLDLTLNNLDLAGVMALSSGLKANHTMRCLDLNIPPADEEMARMCRDILNTCIRNTEEAEKNSHASSPDGSSGRGQGKGVWGMIEESELAKSFRQDDQKKTEAGIVARARVCKEQLEDMLARVPSSSSAPATPVQDVAADLVASVREVQKPLMVLIGATVEPARLQELLALNDELTALLARCAPQKLSVAVHGLGIHVENGKANGSAGGAASGNGHAVQFQASGGAPEESDDEPVTPRVDKGKGRAEPEPEEPEKVLSPTFLITESDDEDGDGQELLAETADGLVSPTDRSRSWVEEEGEVFRKGTVLLGPEEMEGEYDGEELRRELLEAMVERPPPRALVDEFTGDLLPERPVSPPTSPQERKPPPRPYIRRSRSSSSANDSNAEPSTTETGVESPASTATSPTTPTSPSVQIKAFLSRRLSATSLSSKESKESKESNEAS
ncbi:RNI-like protein [Wolfiporia cocos MD-104 SS10]|uniref:RNI-like protein n=1 Tax=Wolfiporia cocos (strain MD-104) TaxID=742152 RepID=A0A2H3JJL0_WOLCO|nr:RNI-like protein [Wolfiporia cocos MD-104 SS10]